MPDMNLMGKRVLITNADVFMGPVPVDVKLVAANYLMLKRPIGPARSAPSLFAG